MAQAERQVALAHRLPALLGGEQRPADSAERLAVAPLCLEKRFHAAAVRSYDKLLRTDPALAESRVNYHRYNAACALALAGCGQGKGESPPDAIAKATLSRQALGWRPS